MFAHYLPQYFLKKNMGRLRIHMHMGPLVNELLIDEKLIVAS